MMSYSNSLLFREAGSLINRPVTVRTIPRFWHPRTGFTAFLLLLSATTELVIINLVPQHELPCLHYIVERPDRNSTNLPRKFPTAAAIPKQTGFGLMPKS